MATAILKMLFLGNTSENTESYHLVSRDDFHPNRHYQRYTHQKVNHVVSSVLLCYNS